MGLLDRFRKTTEPPAEKKSLTLGTSDSLGEFLKFGMHGGQTASGAVHLYEQSTAVSVPINMVADQYKTIDPVLKIDGKFITEHPILDLLNDPSPFYTSELFRETLGKEFLITGESIIVGLGNIDRPPLELQPISTKNTTVVEGPGGFAKSIQVSGNTMATSYSIDRIARRVRYVDGGLRDLKQIRGFSTRNNSILRGQSLLVSASLEARQHILGGQHNVSILNKGGRISLIFNFDQDMEEDDFLEAKRRIREQYAGPNNAGEIAVSANKGLKVEEVGTTNKDMDFLKGQILAKEAVSLTYKVPLPLVSTSAATFNNYQTAIAALYDNAVLPLFGTVYGGLGQWLLPRYGLDPAKVKITFDPESITALRMRMLEELLKRKQVNVETPNELRQLLQGREPLEGADDLLVPANLVPAGSDIFTNDEPNADDDPERLMNQPPREDDADGAS